MSVIFYCEKNKTTRHTAKSESRIKKIYIEREEEVGRIYDELNGINMDIMMLQYLLNDEEHYITTTVVVSITCILFIFFIISSPCVCPYFFIKRYE